MAQVGGDVGVHPGGAGRAEKGVAGPAGDGDGGDEPVRVAGRAHPAGGGGQPASDLVGEVVQDERLFQGADAPDPAAALRVGRVGVQRAQGPADTHGPRQSVGDPGSGGVGVGVRGVQGGARADEAVHDPALGGVGGHAVHTAEHEWVMGDDQVRAPEHGLVDDRFDGVDGEEDLAHGLLRVAARESDGVPRSSPRGRVDALEGRGDVGQAGMRVLGAHEHETRASAACARPESDLALLRSRGRPPALSDTDPPNHSKSRAPKHVHGAGSLGPQEAQMLNHVRGRAPAQVHGARSPEPQETQMLNHVRGRAPAQVHGAGSPLPQRRQVRSATVLARCVALGPKAPLRVPRGGLPSPLYAVSGRPEPLRHSRTGEREPAPCP